MHDGSVLNATITTYILGLLHRLPSGLVLTLVVVLVFGEAGLFIGFVIPGETAVVVAGVVASQGRINLWFLCLLVVLAAIIGDSVGYAIGHRYGEHLMKLPIIKGRRVALDRALEGLRQRGPIYVFVGRFTAFLRAVMPGLAGMSKMHYRRFFVANALGGVIWGIGFTLLGYFAGHAIVKVEHYASIFGIALLVIVITVVVLLHLRHKKRDAENDASWVATHDTGDSTKGA